MASPVFALDPVDEPLPGPIPGYVMRIIDGDTIRVRARVWLGEEIEVFVRLRGVDTPERHSKCESEHAGAERATQFVNDLFPAGTVVSLSHISRDKYGGRVVANLADQNGQDLSQALLQNGLAHPYDGGHKQPWCAGDRGRENEE